MKFFSKIFFLLIVSLAVSCLEKPVDKKFIIGFSQCVESDKWRQTMLEGMKRELAFHSNITFIYKQADGNDSKQIEQVKELMDEKIDLLIISPNEALPLTPIVEEVFNKAIPVIVIDRKIASETYTAYVGADNYEVGQIAGEYAAILLKKQGTVSEIMGLSGSSPAIERHKGFLDALKAYPHIRVVNQISGNWLQSQAFSEVSQKAIKIVNSDLVFAQNDMMALGTKEALQKYDPDNHVKIIGIDALPGKDAGIEFVAQKKITASILYPTGGEEAIRLALKILNHEEYKKENILNTLVVDSTNVRLMKLQTDKISSQQNDIEKQQLLVEEQRRIFKNQKFFLGLLATVLLLSLFLGGAVYYSWRKNKKITRKLQLQNEEISIQQNKLIEISSKAEVAHQAKVNFFTNISHEFRTPLTLILSPIEELLENSRIQSGTKQTVQLVQRNVMRLYRLVNQLMDFRKIEFDKMKLRASENDVVSFVREITDSYAVLAKKKHIDLRFFSSEKSLNVLFDTTMIDKVIFNLLSNAFKFTKENGYIHVSVSNANEHALITIEDNGIGMSKDAIEHAFEPFFQGEYENYKGSGLGLALSKEFIDLHGGNISVKSEKWKGTKFFISILLGNKHIAENEIVTSQNPENTHIVEDAKFYTTELLPIETDSATEPVNEKTNKNNKCILIVEDNGDLRNYLKDRLGKNYTILETEDGNTAIQLAIDNIPDLVICDVVIPGKNGLEVTKILKGDIRTTHIPVILLTSRSDERQKLEGMETQADSYLTKPFSLPLLEKTISNFISNKEKTIAHYSGAVYSEEKQEVEKKADRKFINNFSSIVESNIPNEKFIVEDICNEMGISRVQLYRKLNNILHCSVNDYIIDTRLNKAKYFLRHEELSISEVAFRTGFSSASYFSTIFKNKVGCTPSEYKTNEVREGA